MSIISSYRNSLKLQHDNGGKDTLTVCPSSDHPVSLSFLSSFREGGLGFSNFSHFGSNTTTNYLEMI